MIGRLFAVLAIAAGMVPMTPAWAEGKLLDLSAQSANIRGWVDTALGEKLMPWDDAAAMIGQKAPHISRHTMLYAAGLLLRNRPDDFDRAYRAIRSVLNLQYDAPGKKWHGTFKRNELEPDTPKRTLWEKAFDENWREFIGTAQIVLLEGCPDRLDPALREEMRAALRRACEGAHARNVSWKYTNIALMNAYLLAWGGRQFDMADWSRHGVDLAQTIYKEFCRYQAFQEYNSPTYSGTDLYALALWRALPVFPEMARMGKEMEEGLWRDLARHYHAGLHNLCGPFDRSYGMDMNKYLAKVSIAIALALDRSDPLPDPDKVLHHDFEMGFAPLMAALGMNMPVDAAPHFQAFQGSRRFELPLEAGLHPRTAQSWLENNFMVGAEQTGGVQNRNDQAHPFTLHWKMPGGGVGWMRMLHSAPVDPRIVEDMIVFTPIQTNAPSPKQPIEFEVYAPGITKEAFQETRWDLPGLPLDVKNQGASPESAEKDGLFYVRFMPAGSESQNPCLTFRIPVLPAQ